MVLIFWRPLLCKIPARRLGCDRICSIQVTCMWQTAPAKGRQQPGGCLWEQMFVAIYCFCCLFCRDLWYDVPLHVLLTCQKPDFPGKWWPTRGWDWLVAEQMVLLPQQSPAAVCRMSTWKVTWASCWKLGVAKARLGWKENMESKRFVR